MDNQLAKQALLHGDPRMIYPILTWMLQKMPELQKRAYLAKFLVNVEVPEHMFTDEEVVEVYQSYMDLQQEFKEVHKTSEKYKSQLISPHEIKKAIMQMEEDKGMLEQKVDALKSKLESVDRFDEMLQATHGLRLQQDEQVKLQDRLKEQKAQLLQAEHRLNGLVATLNEKRAQEAGSADTTQLLQKLEREVMEMEHKVLETLPLEIQQKQRRMEELQQVASPLPAPHSSDRVPVPTAGAANMPRCSHARPRILPFLLRPRRRSRSQCPRRTRLRTCSSSSRCSCGRQALSRSVSGRR